VTAKKNGRPRHRIQTFSAKPDAALARRRGQRKRRATWSSFRTIPSIGRWKSPLQKTPGICRFVPTTEPDGQVCGRTWPSVSRSHSADKPVYGPVDAVLVGRRNNTSPRPEAPLSGLAVYNPTQLPDLSRAVMDFICSLNGKRSRRRLQRRHAKAPITKARSKRLTYRPTADLNNAPGQLHPHRPGRVFQRTPGISRPESAVDHGHQFAEAGNLVAGCRPRSASHVTHTRKNSGNHGDLSVRGRKHHGQPAGVSHQDSKFVATFWEGVRTTPRRCFDDSILKPEITGSPAFAMA